MSELPDSTFEAEAEHTTPIETIGNLSEAYVTNTYGLRRANLKLETICRAANRCEEEQTHEE